MKRESPPELLQRALDLTDRGDLDGAVKVLAEEIPLQDYTEDVRWLTVLTYDLAVLCEKLDRLDLGIEYLRKALASVPDDLSSLYTLVRFLVLTGRMEEARIATENFRSACGSSTHELRSAWADLLPALEAMLEGEAGNP